MALEPAACVAGSFRCRSSRDALCQQTITYLQLPQAPAYPRQTVASGSPLKRSYAQKNKGEPGRPYAYTFVSIGVQNFGCRLTRFLGSRKSWKVEQRRFKDFKGRGKLG